MGGEGRVDSNTSQEESIISKVCCSIWQDRHDAPKPLAV
jgi:hypothetical protein